MSESNNYWTSQDIMNLSKQINIYQGDLNIKDIIMEAHLDETDEALNICDLTSVVNKFAEWQKLMPRIKPYYAVKCNNDNVIVRTLAELGACFDCASKNEIKEVLELGVDPNRIIFANPCKPPLHLDYARENNVATSTVDNEFEIFKIHKIYPDSNLVIRFRCDAKEAQYPLGDKFGCDAVNDATALMLLAKSLQLNVIGVSFHVGSSSNDFSVFDRAICLAKNIFNSGALLGFDMKVLDIGGGFPGDNDSLFKMIADTVNLAIDEHFPDDKIEIIAEPGRYFVHCAYTLICRINGKREIRTDGMLDTKMYYLNEGVYGSFVGVLYEEEKIVPIHFLKGRIFHLIIFSSQEDENDNLPKFKTLIWGPTCDATDKITENIYLPNLSIGDYLGFPNMGAYTVPFACTFNGFSSPKTQYFMKISGGKHSIIFNSSCDQNESFH